MPAIRCPICGKPVDLAETPAMPFCSARCQQIDLRRWLGEEYGLPLERPEESDDEFDSPD
jgi:endogenous inhibitor of DNA gyrase (YacG/DUF329 family)